jgi:hypothetical protein
MNAASLFGRILPNFVADSVGPYNVMLPFLFVNGIVIFGWLGVTNRAGLIVFSIV